MEALYKCDFCDKIGTKGVTNMRIWVKLFKIFYPKFH